MSDRSTDGVLAGAAAGMDTDEQEKQEVPWEDVDSSRFTRMRHDPSTLKLSITWKNGTVGHYLDVPATEYERFRSSDSLGKHLQNHIIPQFKYEAEKKD